MRREGSSESPATISLGAEPPPETSASSGAAPDQPPSTPPAESSQREILVRVEDIEVNPFQPRREFGEGEISALAESLKEHDLLQPVLVRRHGSKWQLISGERRLRAAIEAGWQKIPARIKTADDRLVAELAIVENLQRQRSEPDRKGAVVPALLARTWQHPGRTGPAVEDRSLDDCQSDATVRIARIGTKRLTRRQDLRGSRAGAAAVGRRRRQIEFCKQIMPPV